MARAGTKVRKKVEIFFITGIFVYSLIIVDRN